MHHFNHFLYLCPAFQRTLKTCWHLSGVWKTSILSRWLWATKYLREQTGKTLSFPIPAVKLLHAAQSDCKGNYNIQCSLLSCLRVHLFAICLDQQIPMTFPIIFWGFFTQDRSQDLHCRMNWLETLNYTHCMHQCLQSAFGIIRAGSTQDPKSHSKSTHSEPPRLQNLFPETSHLQQHSIPPLVTWKEREKRSAN